MPSRTPLNRERVLRAAVALADEHGIDALSMRRLARTVGVEAMSLYNHVANKDDILAGMVELVVGEVDLAADEPDWKAATRRRAISAHEVFLRHPWACSFWVSGQEVGPAQLGYADALLRGLREGGFSNELSYHGFHALQSHVSGFTLYVLSFRFDKEELKELAAAFLREFPAEEYPDLAEHIRQHMEPSDEHQRAFEFGLDLILDGLERLRDAA
jgi:AcrR family transcriptional regulator